MSDEKSEIAAIQNRLNMLDSQLMSLSSEVTALTAELQNLRWGIQLDNDGRVIAAT